MAKGSPAEPITREPFAGVQPAVVVHDIAPAGYEGKATLADCNRSSQGWQVRLGDGAPAGQTVLTEPDGHAVASVVGEHPRGVT